MASNWTSAPQGKSTKAAAKVTKLGDGKVQISLLPKMDKMKKPPVVKSQPTFPGGNPSQPDVTRVFLPDDLPLEFPQNYDTILNVLIEDDGKVKEFQPYTGKFKGRFVKFGRTPYDNPVPTLSEYESKFGDTHKLEQTFWAIFKVEQKGADGSIGMFDDVQVWMTLRYRLTNLVTGKVVNVAFRPTANNTVGWGFDILPNGTTGFTWSEKIYQLKYAGAYDGDPFTYTEDEGQILHGLELNMQKANKLIELEVVEGKVYSISPVEEVQAARRKAVETNQEVFPSNPDEM
jgi:hypothetical protein